MDKVLEKFGNDKYAVNEATFIMGVNHLLAKNIAGRFRGFKTVIDTCCGAGFMVIALAKMVDKVIAVDLSEEHLNLAINNSKIADVFCKVKFINDNILDIDLGKFRIDAAFLDPDWANTEQKNLHVTSLSEMLPRGDKLFKKINLVTKNIALRLPKEFNLNDLKELPECEIQKVYLNGEFKFYCAYFGKLAKVFGNTELKI